MIRQEVSGMARGDTNISYGGVTVNIYSQAGQDISELAMRSKSIFLMSRVGLDIL